MKYIFELHSHSNQVIICREYYKFSIQRMKSKIFRKFKSSNPIQVLKNARNLMRKQKQLKKIQQSLVYLNNSFNYNIQMQETYIDISKGKRKIINSGQIKKLYQLFSQNKANQCIFLKTYNTETQVQRHRSIIDDEFINQNSFNSSFMNIIQEEEEELIESDKNIIKNESNKQKIKKNSFQKTQNSTFQFEENQHNTHQQGIDSKKQQLMKKVDSQEISFLLKRIYCRLIQKMLVKVAFYTMNSNNLQCIAESVNILTINLQTSIRKLKYFKDTRFLHQTILKIYKENFIIQAQIYKSLVNGGYIISVDEFYRVNGLDADSKQFYQRNSELLQVMRKQDDQKKQEDQKKKIRQLKRKEQKQKQIQKAQKLKKKQIQKINNQIQERYKYCLYEIKQLLKCQAQEDKPVIKQNQGQEEVISEQINKRNSLNYVAQKSTIINRSSHQKIKPFRKSKFSNINEELNQTPTQKKTDKIFYETISTPRAFAQVSLRNRKQEKMKSMLPLEKRLSAISSQFSKILKSVPNSKLSVSTKHISQKFIQFIENQNDKNKLNQNQRANNIKSSPIKSKKHRNRSDSSLFQSIGLNKILKLYQKKHSLNQKIIKETTKQVLQQLQKAKQRQSCIGNVTQFCCNQLPSISKNQKSISREQNLSIFCNETNKKQDKIDVRRLRTQYTNHSAMNFIDKKIVKNFQKQYRYSLLNKNQMDYYHKKKFNLSKKSPRFPSNFIIFNNFQNLSTQNSIRNNVQLNSKTNNIKKQNDTDQKESIIHNFTDDKNIPQSTCAVDNLYQILKNFKIQKNCQITQKKFSKSEKLIQKSKHQDFQQIKNNNVKKNNLSKFWYLKQNKNSSSMTTWQKQNIIQSTNFSIFRKNISNQTNCKESIIHKKSIKQEQNKSMEKQNNEMLNQNNAMQKQNNRIQIKFKAKILRKAYRSTNISPTKKVILNQIQEEKNQQLSQKVYQIYDVRRKLFIL